MPIKKRKLTPEQKRERGRSMIAKLIMDEAKRQGRPNPFPRKTEEQKLQERKKTRNIELKMNKDHIRKNIWIREYTDPKIIKEIDEEDEQKMDLKE